MEEEIKQASIEDVIKKMKENSEAFKKFCEETYARFFVLEKILHQNTF